MADDAGTSTQRTTYTPSPLDEQKAKTVNALREILFPALTPDLSGAMTSKSQEGMDVSNQKGIASSASGGLQKGDVGILNNLSTSRGNNNSALNMALQLYGYGGSMGPSSSTKSKASPVQAASAIGGAGSSGYGLAKEAYKMYDDYVNQGYQNFDYSAAVPESTFTGQGAYTLEPAGGYAASDFAAGNLDYGALFGSELGGLASMETLFSVEELAALMAGL